jgi:hypothetical protein
MDMDMVDLLSLSCSLLKIGFLPVNEYGRLVSAHRVDKEQHSWIDCGMCA